MSISAMIQTGAMFVHHRIEERRALCIIRFFPDKMKTGLRGMDEQAHAVAGARVLEIAVEVSPCTGRRRALCLVAFGLCLAAVTMG